MGEQAVSIMINKRSYGSDPGLKVIGICIITEQIRIRGRTYKYCGIIWLGIQAFISCIYISRENRIYCFNSKLECMKRCLIIKKLFLFSKWFISISSTSYFYFSFPLLPFRLIPFRLLSHFVLSNFVFSN